jgi:hypothetical protein
MVADVHILQERTRGVKRNQESFGQVSIVLCSARQGSLDLWMLWSGTWVDLADA